jgi:hypothetical protein
MTDLNTLQNEMMECLNSLRYIRKMLSQSLDALEAEGMPVQEYKDYLVPLLEMAIDGEHDQAYEVRSLHYLAASMERFMDGKNGE